MGLRACRILQRHFRQDRQLIVDQVHGWLGAIVSVVLAIRGFGPMSLAIGQVSGAMAGAILLTVFSPVPFRFGFNSAQARKLACISGCHSLDPVSWYSSC